MKLIHCFNNKKNIYEFDTFDQMLFETSYICNGIDKLVKSVTKKINKDEIRRKRL